MSRRYSQPTERKVKMLMEICISSEFDKWLKSNSAPLAMSLTKYEQIYHLTFIPFTFLAMIEKSQILFCWSPRKKKKKQAKFDKVKILEKQWQRFLELDQVKLTNRFDTGILVDRGICQILHQSKGRKCPLRDLLQFFQIPVILKLSLIS